jgi:dienelactone hydrolase
MKRNLSHGLVASAFIVMALPAHGRVVEEAITLRTEVRDVRGRSYSHPFQVTIYRDDAWTSRQPFMILNHGRAGKTADRAKTALTPYGPNARYFVSRGFVVFAPLRIGYGATGGPDVEDSGTCNGKVYPPVYEAAAQQSLAVIDHAKAQPFVDIRRGLVVGQSFGGTTALTLAAKDVPGVLGAVNFAGGGGGNPIDSPEQPCRTDLLRALFADYGKTARIPTLWVYSENDRYWGPKLPREWFDGFIASGGKGRFVTLPPYKQDGHPSFTGQPDAWRPQFEAFQTEVMGK